MAMLKDVERIEVGQSLKNMNTQAMNAINQLKGLKVNLSTLKAKVKNDTINFTADDETEIDNIIATLNTQIGKI
jgi:hypothetical protein